MAEPDWDRLLTEAAEIEKDYLSTISIRKSFKQRLAESHADLEHTLAAQVLIQNTAQQVQKEVHAQIAGVVTRCLKAVFGDKAYDFEIQFEKKRGKTEARLYFVRDGHEVSPMGGVGGGVLDVAAFALRLAALLLSQPRRRRTLVLDEPFKHLSKQYRPVVAQLLVELSEELKVQIIQTTHDPALQIGSVVEIGG